MVVVGGIPMLQVKKIYLSRLRICGLLKSIVNYGATLVGRRIQAFGTTASKCPIQCSQPVGCARITELASTDALQVGAEFCVRSTSCILDTSSREPLPAKRD
jgi:hypothetical protein